MWISYMDQRVCVREMAMVFASPVSLVWQEFDLLSMGSTWPPLKSFFMKLLLSAKVKDRPTN